MSESYSKRAGEGVARRQPGPAAVAESSPQTAHARELIAQLLPGLDADRIVRALLAERDGQDPDAPTRDARYDSAVEVAERELARVRAQFALGASARLLQHAFNNPLTALLAEAQLLELEALPDDQRLAVTRILDLARRLVALSRRLGDAGP